LIYSFSSIQEECEYWKQEARSRLAAQIELQQEYEQSNEQARIYEQELEQELNATTSQYTELQRKFELVQSQFQDLKNKYVQDSNRFNQEVTQLQDANQKLAKEKDSLTMYVRDLEQVSTNATENERALTCTLAQREQHLLQTMQRCSQLEGQVSSSQLIFTEVLQLREENVNLKADVEYFKSKYESGVQDQQTRASLGVLDNNILNNFNQDLFTRLQSIEAHANSCQQALTPNKLHHHPSNESPSTHQPSLLKLGSSRLRLLRAKSERISPAKIRTLNPIH
jgi:chromosome segregation ATPase